MLLQALCIISNPSVHSNWSNSPETLNSGQNWRFFVPCDLEVWRMTLKNNRAPLLCCFKLCASFHSHRCIQTGVTVRKRPIWVKIGDILPPVTFEFNGWSWKTIGHLFDTTLSFVHHFKAINEFKLELQSGNAQFGSKSVIFFVPCDLEIWWMTIGHISFTILNFVHHFQWIQTGVTVRKRPIRVKIGNFFIPCDLEIWWMTLKNNRAPVLCYIKLCASFYSHHWIKTGVTVRKRPIWVQINDFFSRVTLKFDGWPWKTTGNTS